MVWETILIKGKLGYRILEDGVNPDSYPEVVETIFLLHILTLEHKVKNSCNIHMRLS